MAGMWYTKEKHTVEQYVHEHHRRRVQDNKLYHDLWKTAQHKKLYNNLYNMMGSLCISGVEIKQSIHTMCCSGTVSDV